MGEWIGRQQGAYFGNAGVVKDHRVQLRGSRAILLWGAFLLIFSVFAYFSYSSATAGSRNFAMPGQGDGTVSLSQAQFQLHAFYQQVIALLSGMVVLLAPAIGATAVVSDRDRRFLELLECSPMSAKYYLVGKLISTYRSLWMLIILSVPLVAVGAVMGGATYGDVLETLFVISLDGLVFASAALAISAGSVKVNSAIILSYAATIAIVLAASTFTIGLGGGMMRRGTPTEIPITAYLTPFRIFVTESGGVTTIFGIEFPAWLAFAGFALLLVYVFLLGAGSAIAPKHVRETTVFRVLVVALTALYGFLGNRAGIQEFAQLGASSLPIAVAVPAFSCFVLDGVPKFVYDGRSRLKTIFTAAPSGALAYLALLVTAFYVGAASHMLSRSDPVDLVASVCYFAYSMGLCIFVWGVSRWVSQWAPILASARGVTFIGVLLLFTVITSVSSAESGPYGADSFYTAISPLSPTTHSQPSWALIWGAILGVCGMMFSLVKLGKFHRQWEEWRQVAA